MTVALTPGPSPNSGRGEKFKPGRLATQSASIRKTNNRRHSSETDSVVLLNRLYPAGMSR